MTRWPIACVLATCFISAPLAAERMPWPPRLEALRTRQLIELSPKQSRQVCEAANDRQDLCAAAGRWQVDSASCEAYVESCRAQHPPPQIDCSLARYELGPTCTATVDDYLACIEDWNHALDCSEISALSSEPPARAACVPLLEACPHFIPEYGDPLTYVPRCDAASSPVRVDTDDDVRGLDTCRPVPTRMVALGDSIAACFDALDPDGSTACAPDLIAEYVRESYAPELSYESFAVPGARTEHGIQQAQQVAPGPGHIFVWVYLGGNDVGACSLPDEAESLACIDREINEIRAEWEPILAYFSDATLFPDGATFMLNTQYGLRDECENPGGYGIGTTPARAAKLKEYNQRVFIDRALERADTIAVDQYPDWVGRANNADNARCPHCYRGDNSSWLNGVHPTATGQHHIADKWKLAIDAIYAQCPAR